MRWAAGALAIAAVVAGVLLLAQGADEPELTPAASAQKAPPTTGPVASACVDEHLATNALKGLTVEKARAQVKGDCEVRVVEIDGEAIEATGDFQQSRINVAVRRGRVSRVVGLY